MSSRCLIVYEDNAIYCHFDGYPSYVGMVLKHRYKDEDKIKELISHGDISSLGLEIGSKDGKKETVHWEHGQAMSECSFYHRDFPDEELNIETIDHNTYINDLAERYSAEYVYVYSKKDRSWNAFHVTDIYPNDEAGPGAGAGLASVPINKEGH